MNLSWLIPVHRHLGEMLLVLPIVVVLISAFKGKSLLPRITAVLLDVQLVLGIVTLVFVKGRKPVSLLHIVCMVLALGLAHAFAKKEPKKIAAGFAGVFVLLLLGYAFQKGLIPGGTAVLF